MASPAATLGDGATHPGQIITSCSRHYANNGKLIARQGDIFDCQIHGPNPIVGNVSSKVTFEGPFSARHGSVTECGAIIIATSTRPEV